MFAVIRSGGKQYKVAKNDVIAVEKLKGEAGSKVTLGEVLMLGKADKVTVGAPLVAGASVAAEILEQTRAKKIIVFKKKRRKDYRRKQGHRQDLTVLRIIAIEGAKKKPAASGKAASDEDQAPAKKAPVKKAAAKKAAPKKAPARKATAKKAAPKKKAEDS